jgi:hypothetical protein
MKKTIQLQNGYSLTVSVNRQAPEGLKGRVVLENELRQMSFKFNQAVSILDIAALGEHIIKTAGNQDIEVPREVLADLLVIPLVSWERRHRVSDTPENPEEAFGKALGQIPDLDVAKAIPGVLGALAGALGLTVPEQPEPSLPDPAEVQSLKHDFGWAIRRLRDGCRVRREGWNGKGMWVELQPIGEDQPMDHPYIFMSDVNGKLFPWNPNQLDMLADDWEHAV